MTERGATSLSPILAAAARGELPPWAEVSDSRRAHMERVAGLLGGWALGLGLSAAEVATWRATGWLHDALRDADPASLRPSVPEPLRDLPPALLHGPAAAERLRGQVDERVVDAIRYHTVGHPSLARLGRALYLADFLEPGRTFAVDWRAGLRARMPHELDAVLREVVAARIRHLVESRMPLRAETAGFWSRLVEEAACTA